jgi:aminoglycoside 3-N-acetyltransferase
MSLEDVIGRSTEPRTVGTIVRDLAEMGVREGMTLIVHSSLSRMGYVVGGAQAAVMALERAVGEEGTLVMPTFTGDLTDPALWQEPAVPAQWHALIRETMPPFEVDLTPTWQMGAIVECFRAQGGTLRSEHPFASWAARGKHAAVITTGQSLAGSSGEQSPPARLYDLDAWILLLGVGHDRNSSLHLAEFRNRFAPRKKTTRGYPARREDGGTEWRSYEDIFLYEEDFPAIGAAFEALPEAVRVAQVGDATSRLMRQRALVDFAVGWMNEHRSLGGP